MNEDFVKQVAEQLLFCTKEILTFDETARYMGIPKSSLYKLTMSKRIPHYKPTGKQCFFNRKELEVWLQSGKVSTSEELTQKAQNYCSKNKM